MRRAGTRLAAVTISIAALLVLTGCGLQQDVSQIPNLGNGPTGPATPITAATITGERFNWSTTRGHVVVLDFWASWCGPCRGEQSDLNKLAAQWSPQGVVFVGVDLADTNADGSAYERDLKVPYPSVNDAAEVIASEYNVAAPPTLVIVDSHGNIVDRFLGTLAGVSTDLTRLA